MDGVPTIPQTTPQWKSPKTLLWLALLLAVAGGFYFFWKSGYLGPIASPTPSPDAATAQLQEQGSSDELTEIEADLEATSFTDLDAELGDIERELGQ